MRDKELKLEDVEASHTLDGAGTLRWYLRRGNCAFRSSFFSDSQGPRPMQPGQVIRKVMLNVFELF